MRRLFSQEQLNKIIQAMNMTPQQIEAKINQIIGDIALEGAISDLRLYLFAPQMYVWKNKLNVDAPNLSISNNSLIIL